MSSKILLIMPKHREGDRTFPFGIATVFSTLKQHGFEVDLIDCVLAGKDLQELITPEQIRQYGIIGIGGLVSCYKTVKHDIVPFIREHAPDALIMIGGYLGISVPDLLLANCLCEVVFQGDAEESLSEFLAVVHEPDRWGTVKGISFLDKDRQRVNTGIRVLKDLDSVYVPYYKYMDIAAYNQHLPADKRYYPLVVELGCPYKCNFCFNSIGNIPRGRPPESVIEEIRVAVQKYGYREMFMMAENLLSKPKWIRRFCELLDEHNLNIRWSVAGHANTINEDILVLLKRHGCYRIGVGFENFSQKILDNMNKRVKVETYEKVLELLLKYDFEFSGTMIFGYWGEDDRTIEENIKFCNKYAFAPFYYWIQAYPLTTLYAECLERGLIKNEEKYIEHLRDNTEFLLNLTEYPDAELFRLRDRLHKMLKKNRRNPRVLLQQMKIFGLGYCIRKAFKTARRFFFL